jgi:hypothetical protein
MSGTNGLNVIGAVGVNGAVSFNGDGSTLNVDGFSTFNKRLNITTGGLGVTGAVLIGGTGSTLDVNGLGKFTNGLHVTADGLGVTGGANIYGALGVTGAVALSSTLAVGGAATMNGAMNVSGAVNMTSTLAVTGEANFSNNVTVNGDLTVSGSMTSINTSNLQINDATILIANGNNISDGLKAGIQIQYKSAGAQGSVMYAGLKRVPVTGISGGEFVFFKDSAALMESSSAADVYATVMADSFVSASDANLKKNIVSLDGALDKLDDLRGVYHDWIDESQSHERQIGVIAQEVQVVYPELVNVGSNGYLAVNYPKLTAVLLQSVKELKAMVLALIAKQAAQ